MKKLLVITVMCMAWILAYAELPQGVVGGNEAYPSDCNGLPIKDVTILVTRGGECEIADSAQTAQFSNAFNIYPGGTFNQSITGMSVNRIAREAGVKAASYRLYSVTPGAPVSIVVTVELFSPGEHKEVNGRKGMFATHSLRDFPLLCQSPRGELTLILNGAVALFDDKNAFFSQGKALTQGNPIANDPAEKGTRFWGETFLEPGIAGIIECGNSHIYVYGAISALISGRNTSDIYSHGGHCYADFEKLYGGVLFSRLGRNRDMALNISGGRQEFQLNDGFLISRFSGSANAGPRAATYLNPRRSFHMTALAKWTSPHWSAEFFYIQPEELTRHSYTRTRYAGMNVAFDNHGWNPGMAFISRVHGQGDYYLPGGKTLSRKGLLLLNPKLWVSDIAGSGVFFKSEYVYEWHTGGGMSANGWYAGVGIDLRNVGWAPRIYYRYAFMQGDDPASHTYTRFDPLLSGGLAEWVQGINMCKVVGPGNLITHRVELQVYPSRNFNMEIDYYHLKADTRYNVGGATALSYLTSKHLGDEITLQGNWSINDNFLLMPLISVAIPGRGLKDSLPGKARCWTTWQLNLFMFF